MKAATDLRWAVVEAILARAEDPELLNQELKYAKVTFLKRGQGSHPSQQPSRPSSS